MRVEADDLSVKYIAVEALKPTEEVDPVAVERLKRTVERSGVWTHPILVERDSLAILDGHHRYTVAKSLGLKVVPSVLTSYADERLELSSWRADMRFFARDVLAAAEEGRLLPPKSTRHHLRAQLPRTELKISALKRKTLNRRDAPAVRIPSRWEHVNALYFEFSRALTDAKLAPSDVVLAAPEEIAPHPLLRRLLLADPAMEALLPGARVHFTLAAGFDAPFDILEPGMIALGPHLLDDRRALAVAARWGLETRAALESGRAGSLANAFRHGASLLAGLRADSVDLVLAGAPDAVVEEMLAEADGRCATEVSEAALEWLRARGPIARRLAPSIEGPAEVGVLALATERLLISGGDTRLAVDPATGLNRYGTTPRPRPEAAHFSSSTASSVSEQGFLLCDLSRRAFKAAAEEAGDAAEVYPAAVDALTEAFRDLLDARGAAKLDLAVAPSGTDLELLTVAVALSAAERRAKPRPLTNILIAPAETGRGVVYAAEGRFFDAAAATGAPVEKGEAAWPEAEIEVRTIGIRAADGAPRRRAEIDADLERETRAAIAAGRRVLIHALPSSKTGLCGPTDETIERLRAERRDRIDVAVDACQFRTSPATLAGWVARGWMVQVTGSKFLTGPPFSGALLLPPRMRGRAARVGRLLAAAPGVGSAADWCGAWRAAMPQTAGAATPNFGAVFRWLPALLEARMFEGLTDAFKAHAFAAFRDAVGAKLAASRHLNVYAPPAGEKPAERFAWNDTITCFTVFAPTSGGLAALDPEDCVRVFKLLNRDVSGLLGDLTPAERALLRRPAHIGQPVTIAAESGRPTTYLRVVLGARFFNTIGYAEPSAMEAALQSEIGDALRALDKLDLIASRWARLRHRNEI